MSSIEHASVKHQQIAWLVLAGLLILRIPFLAFIELLQLQWLWVDPVWQVGTYLLTTFLIWWERDRLADFHIDSSAIVIIVLFKPLQTIILRYWGYDDLLTFPKPFSLVIWGIALVFVIVIWKDRSSLPKFQKSSLFWFGGGILAGLGTAILLGYPWSFMYIGETASFTSPLTLFSNLTSPAIAVSFAYQIGMAAVSEEPVFRGFLWGYLRKLGWNDIWILFFQAALFTFAHIYALRVFPISFWIIVPVISLVLGLIVWRSRTITSSMAAHGMINATGSIIANLIAWYRFT